MSAIWERANLQRVVDSPAEQAMTVRLGMRGKSSTGFGCFPDVAADSVAADYRLH